MSSTRTGVPPTAPRHRAVARAGTVLAGVLAAGLALAGCGGTGHAGPSASSTAATATDVAFLSDMLPHHQRAIEIAQLATTRASSATVRSFAARIVREQTPELARMQALAATVPLDTVKGAEQARNRVDDAQLAALQALTGTAFDRQFVTLSIASEQGAVQMSQPERTGGHVPGAVALANAINSAPTGEIPQLQALLAALPAA